jgi:hypothetical protein
MEHPIFEALQSGRLVEVHSMLTQEPSVAAVRDQKSNSVAMFAAMHGQIDVLMHIKGLVMLCSLEPIAMA